MPETLGQLQRRMISESYGISIEEVNENLDRCSCEWTPQFRAKIEAGIRSRRRDDFGMYDVSEKIRETVHQHSIEVSLDLILGRH